MNNENYNDRVSLKLTQKKAAQCTGLSFLSAISTPSILTVLNQTGAPLWLSVSLGCVCLVSAVYFFMRSNRMNQLAKAKVQATSDYARSQEKPAHLRAS